jgi:hypothetical protein
MDIKERLNRVSVKELDGSKELVTEALIKLNQYINHMAERNDEEQQIAARRFAFSMIQTYAAGLLLEHADWASKKDKHPQATITATRWCSKNITSLLIPSEAYRMDSRTLALDR